jgi:hypothetical protein
MRAVIVYESMYGNTRRIAEEIGHGLAGHEVVVAGVHEVTAGQIGDADLVVLGAPTHVHGLPRPSTRRGAVEAVTKEPGLSLEPDPTRDGVRELLATLADGRGRAAAAFDTRVDMNPLLSGRASKAIARDLHRHGFQVLVEPESFLVDRETRLLEGELERARAWGAGLAAALTGALTSR